MLKSLSISGIGEIDRLEDLISTAAGIGFDAIEATPELLNDCVNRLGLDGTRSQFVDNKIELAATNLPVDWRSTDAIFEQGLAGVRAIAEISQALGGKRLFSFFMPSTDQLPVPYFMTLTQRVRTLAKILSSYDSELALEYVGPHHLRSAWKYPFIGDCAQTMRWFELINEPNVGVLMDSFHWYTCEESVDTISNLDPAIIKYVHMSDAPAIPIPQVLDNDRLHPGLGVIDLVSFLTAVHGLGYRGPVTQEVLTPEPPTESRAELAKKSQVGYDRLFREAGVN